MVKNRATRIAGADAGVQLHRLPTFNDSRAAEQLLASLTMEPSVEFASLEDMQGKVLAKYSTGTKAASNPPKANDSGLRLADPGCLEIRQKVSDQEEQVGRSSCGRTPTISVRQLISHGKIVGVVMGSSLLVAIGLSLVLQKAISNPIQQLSATAAQITANRDYTGARPSSVAQRTGEPVRRVQSNAG